MKVAAFIFSAGLLLTSCSDDPLMGTWEVDVEKTISQYQTVPNGYESLSIAEFKQLRRGELEGRAYIFSRERPKRPDWGETNFRGSVESLRKGKMSFYGAWRFSTSQPPAIEVCAYTVNSGSSYWPAGQFQMNTNASAAVWYPYRDSANPVVLRRARR